MMEKIAKYKKYIISIALMLSLSILFINMKYLLPKKYEELPEVRLKEIKSNKAFAIMVQNGDNYEEYKSNENAWPGDEFVFKEAKCVDNNGSAVDNAITFESATKTAILETDKTVSCTLYFDKSTLGKLRENEKLANKDNLSSDKPGGMYRYQGTDDVRNWICFGTTDNCGLNDELIDKYMYRIIGIIPGGELYLIKETSLRDGDITKFVWNSAYQLPTCLGDACEWPNVDLYKRLNGTASNGNPIFVNSSEYDYLKSEDSNGGREASEWYKLIEEHYWIYGDTNDQTYIKYNGDSIYEIETGNIATKRFWPDDGQETCSSDSPCEEKDYTLSKSIPAKIGLMYIHDVDYAYPGGNPGGGENIKNSWIFFYKDGYNSSITYEWLITRFGCNTIDSAEMSARILIYDGTLGNYTISGVHGARPVFYLNSNVKITSGTGTKTNPFVLSF